MVNKLRKLTIILRIFMPTGSSNNSKKDNNRFKECKEILIIIVTL